MTRFKKFDKGAVMGGRHRGRDDGPRISITFGNATVGGGVVIGDGRPRGGIVIGGREREGGWDERLPIPGYPPGGHRPVFNGAADNRNFGPIMTQEGIDAASAAGPSLVLRYANRGFSESALNDGERIGILYNFDAYGRPVVAIPYDLNNPVQARSYEDAKSGFIRNDCAMRERGDAPVLRR